MSSAWIVIANLYKNYNTNIANFCIVSSMGKVLFSWSGRLKIVNVFRKSNIKLVNKTERCFFFKLKDDLLFGMILWELDIWDDVFMNLH